MRVLVLSDIHANLVALEAVLEDARPFDYTAVWCLGDIVGYGPRPDECIARLRQLQPLVVVGNHDWAVIGRMETDDFNREASHVVLWTRDRLSQQNLAWLETLPSTPITEGDYTLTHGSPRDPIWEYILYPAVARANFDEFTTPFCLIGHTHIPTIFIGTAVDHNTKLVRPMPGQTMTLPREKKVILNPGSVGQPRDSDPRAAYAILDTEKATWLPRRVFYAVEVTQAHMRAAHLPERLITRLEFGS